MKRVLSYLFIFGFSLNLMCQNYTPLLTNGKTWSVEYDGFYSCENQITTCLFALGNDVQINNETYKEVLISSSTTNAVNPYTCQSLSSTPTLLCYLREDIVAKKVYKLEINASSEILFRDFSLEVGNSYTNSDGNIVSVEERNYGSIYGVQTRSLKLKESFNTYPFEKFTTFYEGVGSVYGLLETIWSTRIDGFSNLKEFTIDGVSYQNNQFVLGLHDDNELTKTKVTYDAIQKKILLLNFSSPIKMTLYSVDGKRILTTSFEQQENSIPINSLKKGCYFYQLTQKKSFKRGKLLVY